MEHNPPTVRVSPRREMIITIKDTSSNSSVNLSISGDATIEELKKKYAGAMGYSSTGIRWKGYKLSYGTANLTDSSKVSTISPLSRYANGLTLKATFQEPAIIINVRGLDGRTKKISAYETWTVRRLKEEYALWLGQGWDNVVMLYKAKRLKDTDLLSLYNIEPEGFIQANVRSVGGSDNEDTEE